MAQIKIDSHTHELPNSWDAMTPKQFIDVVTSFVHSTEMVSFKVKAFLALLNIRVPERPVLFWKGSNLFALKFKNHKTFLLTPEQLSEMLPLVDYLFDTDENGEQSPFLVSSRTLNPFPFFKLRFKRYYGPEDKLFNLSFAEYITAETHYMNFLQDNNVIHLESLLASLFRPEDPGYNPKHYNYKGDRREPFNDHLIEYRAKLFESLNLSIKYSIFYYFQGCRTFLTYQFPTVFNSTGGGKKSKFGMLALVDALANNDVTKNEQIRKGSLYDILLRLEQAALSKIEMEAKFNKNK